MSLGRHIFNLQRIANEKLTRSSKEPNVYNKINEVFKGATTGTPELLQELVEVIERESKRATAYLRAKKKELEKAQQGQAVK